MPLSNAAIDFADQLKKSNVNSRILIRSWIERQPKLKSFSAKINTFYGILNLIEDRVDGVDESVHIQDWVDAKNGETAEREIDRPDCEMDISEYLKLTSQDMLAVDHKPQGIVVAHHLIWLAAVSGRRANELLDKNFTVGDDGRLFAEMSKKRAKTVVRNVRLNLTDVPTFMKALTDMRELRVFLRTQSRSIMRTALRQMKLIVPSQNLTFHDLRGFYVSYALTADQVPDGHRGRITRQLLGHTGADANLMLSCERYNLRKFTMQPVAPEELPDVEPSVPDKHTRCECGTIVRTKGLSKHVRTKKHKLLLE